MPLAECADLLGRHQGRAVSFHDETLDGAYASRAKRRVEDWQNDAWVSTYTAIKAGEMARVSTSIEDITGVPALTLDEFLALPRASAALSQLTRADPLVGRDRRLVQLDRGRWIEVLPPGEDQPVAELNADRIRTGTARAVRPSRARMGPLESQKPTVGGRKRAYESAFRADLLPKCPSTNRSVR